MVNEADVSDVIQKLVADAGEILGSKLAMELKAAVPDWRAADYGARSLRDFIVANVAGVTVAGRSGMDVIYSCSLASRHVATDCSPGLDVWRAWTSPNSPFALAINKANGRVLPIRRAAPAPVGHARIDPAPSTEHRAIAREFLERIPEDARDTMRCVVDSPDDHWWRGWLAGLKKLNELSSWIAFREERLQELLKTRLDAAGLHEPEKTVAVEAVAGSRQSRSERGRRSVSKKRVGIRKVVVAVIDRMGDEELRDLKLPVGLVVDVLAETKL